MTLIEAFERGRVSGISDTTPLAETVLSRLFVADDRVYKMYKWHSAFYGDFSSPSFRKAYYRDDFTWNHAMAPDIHYALHGVRRNGDYYEPCADDNADDYYIEMKRIDDTRTLTNLLLASRITPAHIQDIVATLIMRLRALTGLQRDTLAPLFKRSWATLQRKDFNNTRAWATMIGPDLLLYTEMVIVHMERLLARDPYFHPSHPAYFSLAIDVHGDNIFLLPDGIGFLDILPPKPEWRVGDEAFMIARIATDAYVLGSPTLSDAVYDVYASFNPSFPPSARVLYELRSALIRYLYCTMLHHHDRAGRYRAFLDAKIAHLSA